jgi:hypothetical protein
MKNLVQMVSCFTLCILSAYSNASSPPKIIKDKNSISVRFKQKTFDFHEDKKSSCPSTYEVGAFLEKVNLQIVKQIPCEFGPYFHVLNENNDITLSSEPKFNPTWDRFVIVQYTEAGEGTYGIDVWKKEASGKWKIETDYNHPGGAPYLEFVKWKDSNTITVNADFFGKKTGPYEVPIKEVPTVLQFLKIEPKATE